MNKPETTPSIYFHHIRYGTKVVIAEALQAIADLGLDALAGIEPPRGYGRN